MDRSDLVRRAMSKKADVMAKEPQELCQRQCGQVFLAAYHAASMGDSEPHLRQHDDFAEYALTKPTPHHTPWSPIRQHG